jgi:hypothetical protein
MVRLCGLVIIGSTLMALGVAMCQTDRLPAEDLNRHSSELHTAEFDGHSAR